MAPLRSVESRFLQAVNDSSTLPATPSGLAHALLRCKVTRVLLRRHHRLPGQRSLI